MQNVRCQLYELVENYSKKFANTHKLLEICDYSSNTKVLKPQVMKAINNINIFN